VPSAGPGDSYDDDGSLGALDSELVDLDVDAAIADPVPPDVHAKVLGDLEEFRDLALRVQADFENFRKQQSKRQAEAMARANESLVEQLLPVLDAFDAARSHHPDDEALHALGSSLWSVLEAVGLERVADEGAPFDPNLHDAVQTVPPPDVDGAPEQPVVASIMRSGYLFKGRVLRPAMVAVTG
jgi:molecular chaperone GrpE